MAFPYHWLSCADASNTTKKLTDCLGPGQVTLQDWLMIDDDILVM
jgi:hypothetical protein